MMRPMPSVAAEITSGRENSARCAELRATNKPRGTQIHAAAIANTREVVMTEREDTDSAGNDPEKMERHAESESSLLMKSDRYRVPTRGDATMSTAVITNISGVTRRFGFERRDCGVLT